MLLGEFADEIKLALGEVYDDTLLGDDAILYYIGLGVNKLADQNASKQIARGDYKGLTGFVGTFILPVQFDAATGRRYIATPPILSLPNGRGVNFIAYFRTDLPENCPPQVARVQFDATSWRELPLLYADPISVPSAQRPYYIESLGRINLFGMQPQVPQLEVGLVSGFAADDITAEIPLPPEQLFDLRRMILMAANWILMQPNERARNEGADFIPGQPKPNPGQPMSVNDGTLITPTS